MRSITRYGGKVRAIVVELLKIHRPVEPSTIKMIVVRVFEKDATVERVPRSRTVQGVDNHRSSLIHRREQQQ